MIKNDLLDADKIHTSNVVTPNASNYSRTLLAGAIGNGLEFYDFAVYGIFATYIGKTFFPAQSSFVSLLLAIATFGIGFIARPVGALIIGTYADRAGRKAALTLTVLAMGLGTGMIGCIPGHDVIGIWAPVLLVIARLIQGFSAGGEVGSAVSLMMEAAPENKRGIAVSWQIASQPIALMASGLVGYVLARSLPRQALESWGWRVPFLIGIAIVPVGIYIRSHLDETLFKVEVHESGRLVITELVNEHKVPIVLGTMIIAGIAVNQYFFSYMTTYALTALKLPSTVAMLAPVVLGATGAVFALCGGKIIDCYGRKAINVVPRIALMAVAYPAFEFATASKNGNTFLLIIMCLVALNLICYGTSVLVAAECFPRRVRATGYSVAYAVGVTLFGGTAQIAFTWMIHFTGNVDSPIFYVIFGNLMTLIAVLMAIRLAEQRKS